MLWFGLCLALGLAIYFKLNLNLLPARQLLLFWSPVCTIIHYEGNIDQNTEQLDCAMTLLPQCSMLNNQFAWSSETCKIKVVPIVQLIPSTNLRTWSWFDSGFSSETNKKCVKLRFDILFLRFLCSNDLGS